MGISEVKKKIVIDNYFKEECDVNTSIKEAFTKGFELGLKKAPMPQPKTGHWIWQTEDIYRCSECGNDIRVKEVMNIPQYVRCPMCEAKMIEPQESEEQKNCDTCTYSDEVDGSNCYECVKGMRNNYKAKVRDKGCR